MQYSQPHSKMLSIIIPARNEIYLEKTIKNVLDNAEGEIEILVVLDGYIPEPQIIMNDERVIFIHNKESIGQRQSINQAAKIAKGKYIMKLDAHCAVDKGFDVKLAQDCEYDWTVIPRMYNLDVLSWQPKLHKRTDYMYIGLRENGELRAEYYDKQPDTDKEIDNIMCCMGPCFFMQKDRFWELGGCDENHGGWGSQGIEVACKAWLSGGRLVVNKKTWFAHWFRGGGVPEGHTSGFPYHLSGKAVEHARAYSKDLWLNNKWDKQVRNFDWLLNKFSPPNWNMKQDKINELNRLFYKHIHVEKRWMKWRGIPIIKMPTDMIIYQQIIWEKKPDFIIDIGTKFGGSALFYQDMLDIVGKGGKVITIDKFPVKKEKDPRITYLEKGSTDEEVLRIIKETVGDKEVMVIVDGDHRRQQVKRELVAYSNITTKGQYLVLEDCYSKEAVLAGPGEAKDWFLKKSRKLKQTDLDKQFLVGMCRDGFLIKQ